MAAADGLSSKTITEAMRSEWSKARFSSMTKRCSFKQASTLKKHQRTASKKQHRRTEFADDADVIMHRAMPVARVTRCGLQ